MNGNGKENNNNPAVDRALNILEYLTTVKSATIKELSEQLTIPIVSASRLVKTLLHRGYLNEKKGYSASYSLGMKLLSFSQIVYEQIDLRRIAEKHMRSLSDATNQTSQLGILQKNSVVYIDQTLPRSPVSIIAPLHTALPLNVSACGKVLCAFLPPEERALCIEKAELVKSTKQSITDKQEYASELDKAYSDGFAVDIEEFAKGIGCMAAPILNHTGNIIAAVGITGHIESYIDKDDFERLSKSVQIAAKRISEEIGYVLKQES
ncbi:MAG: IclR family transcriptional regulator [Sphaerochaetaceae bacterium]|jgi:DNA-binding IclR family transcriptional regulator